MISRKLLKTPTVRLFAWLAIAGVAVPAGMFALRMCVVLFGNIFSATLGHTNIYEAPSPSGASILTAYQSHGFLDGSHVLYLRSKNEPVRYAQRSYLTGRTVDLSGEIQITDYRCHLDSAQWKDDNNLLITQKCADARSIPGQRKDDSNPIFIEKNIWKDVRIAYKTIGNGQF